MSEPKRAIPAAISDAAKAFFRDAPPLERRRLDPAGLAAYRRALFEPAEAARADRCRAFDLSLEDRELAGVKVQCLTPREGPCRSDRALLYFFGGGHVSGSPTEDLPITAPLARHLGLRLYAPHYRLAPEQPFPAGLDDALAVYGALAAELPPGGLVLAGESAGGNLALALTLRAREAGLPLPAALGLLSPWCDLTASGDSLANPTGWDPTLDYELHLKGAAAAYAGSRDLEDPLISPLYADFAAGFPPTLITSGTRDLLMSGCARLSTALRRAGVPTQLHLWEGLWHVFEWYPELPEAEVSLKEIAAFLGERLG